MRSFESEKKRDRTHPQGGWFQLPRASITIGTLRPTLLGPAIPEGGQGSPACGVPLKTPNHQPRPSAVVPPWANICGPSMVAQNELALSRGQIAHNPRRHPRPSQCQALWARWPVEGCTTRATPRRHAIHPTARPIMRPLYNTTLYPRPLSGLMYVFSECKSIPPNKQQPNQAQSRAKSQHSHGTHVPPSRNVCSRCGLESSAPAMASMLALTLQSTPRWNR